MSDLFSQFKQVPQSIKQLQTDTGLGKVESTGGITVPMAFVLSLRQTTTGEHTFTNLQLLLGPVSGMNLSSDLGEKVNKHEVKIFVTETRKATSEDREKYKLSSRRKWVDTVLSRTVSLKTAQIITIKKYGTVSNINKKEITMVELKGFQFNTRSDLKAGETVPRVYEGFKCDKVNIHPWNNRNDIKSEFLLRYGKISQWMPHLRKDNNIIPFKRKQGEAPRSTDYLSKENRNFIFQTILLNVKPSTRLDLKYSCNERTKLFWYGARWPTVWIVKNAEGQEIPCAKLRFTAFQQDVEKGERSLYHILTVWQEHLVLLGFAKLSNIQSFGPYFYQNTRATFMGYINGDKTLKLQENPEIPEKTGNNDTQDMGNKGKGVVSNPFGMDLPGIDFTVKEQEKPKVQGYICTATNAVSDVAYCIIATSYKINYECFKAIMGKKYGTTDMRSNDVSIKNYYHTIKKPGKHISDVIVVDECDINLGVECVPGKGYQYYLLYKDFEYRKQGYKFVRRWGEDAVRKVSEHIMGTVSETEADEFFFGIERDEIDPEKIIIKGVLDKTEQMTLFLLSDEEIKRVAAVKQREILDASGKLEEESEENSPAEEEEHVLPPEEIENTSNNNNNNNSKESIDVVIEKGSKEPKPSIPKKTSTKPKYVSVKKTSTKPKYVSVNPSSKTKKKPISTIPKKGKSIKRKASESVGTSTNTRKSKKQKTTKKNTKKKK